jgi:hypothetical protein
MLTDFAIPFTSHAPGADGYNADPVGQYVNAKNGDAVAWLLQQKSAGTNTGTATITVLAATNNSGSGATAVPFRYRKKTTGTDKTAVGDVTYVSASGVTTTANENTQYEIEVRADELPDGKPYVALKLTEAVNDPVSVAVNGFILKPRYMGDGRAEATA